MFAIRRHPIQWRLAIFSTMLHPTAFPMIQVKPNSLFHHFGGKRQGGHQPSKGRYSNCKIISVNTRNKLEEVWRSKVPWNDRVLEPTKSGIKRHCKQEAARKTALSHAPGHEVLQSFLHIPRVQYYRTESFAKKRPNSGNSALPTTWKIQEWLTLGMRRQNPSTGCLIQVGHTQHAPRRSFQPRKYCQSFAWPRYISEMDVFIWCTIEGPGNSPR